ncbi:uncharacterized protein [Misgurnus anguillicaudatus]|uniref:uncharacterized protein isoform X3 n=2 Tax=Misgurnus anguillicaudatus TaxID=75329 RepID=UPI003CCFA334
MSYVYRRCVFRCERQTTLFGLPIEEMIRNHWLNFIYNAVPDQYSSSVRLCAAHFTEDCFLNMGEYKAGLAQRLRLKTGSIPTLHVQSDSQLIVKDLPLLTSGQSSLTKTKSTQTTERIQANPESDRRCHKTIIDIGSAFALWQKFRDENGFKTDTELAFYLLSRTGCCADLSARRKKRKLEPLTDVPTRLQMEEYESDSSQPSKDHQCTKEDEDIEVPEICYEVPHPYHTVSPDMQLWNEPAEIEMRSESQIKLEDQSVAPALNNKDIVPECSTSIIKIEIKEEPVETEVQLENRLEISMDSVTTSDKITSSFVQSVNLVSVQVKEEHTEGPLVPNKTHFTGRLRTCVKCGEPMQEYTTGSSGSLNQLQWKCSNGHLMCLFSNNNPT